MANVADLNLIQIPEFPKTDTLVGSGPEYVVLTKSDGVTYGMLTEDFKAFLGTVQIQAPRAISPTDPAPTLSGVYYPTVTQNEAGTPIVYANAGGVEVNTAEGGTDHNSMVQLIYDGSSWVKVNVPIEVPDSASKISDWEPGVTYAKYTVKSYEDKIYRAKQSTTQIPGSGDEWEIFPKNELNDLLASTTITSDATHIFTDSEDEIVAVITKEGDVRSAKFPNGISVTLSERDEDITAISRLIRNEQIDESLYVLTDSGDEIVVIVGKDGQLYVPNLQFSVQQEIENLKKGVSTKSYQLNSEIKPQFFTDLTDKGNSILTKRIINGLSNFAIPSGVMPQNWVFPPSLVVDLQAPRTTEYVPIEMMNGSVLNNDSGVVHPNVVSFEFPVNGFKYWMTINGYPNDLWEITWLYGTNNDDLTGWELISGVPQPFEDNPILEPPYTKSHDSDSFMTYNPLTGEMVVVWRRSMQKPTGETTECRYRASVDGLNWGDVKMFLHPVVLAVDKYLSPGVVFNPEDGLFYMFYVNNKLQYRTNKDLYNPDTWSEPIVIETPIGVNAWHVEVKYVGQSIVLLLHENQTRTPNTDKLWFAASSDLISWSWSATDVLGGTAPLYKGSFLPQFNNDGTIKFKIIYTTDETAPSGESWKLHVTETQSFNPST